MTEHTALILRFLLAALALALGAGAAESPPNILLYTMDTLRADHLGMYGYERDTSPHMDAVAKQGVVFTDAVSTYTHTIPSMVSIFTGMNPARQGAFRDNWMTGIEGFDLDACPNLAGELRKRGYATAFFTNHSMLLQILAEREEWDEGLVLPAVGDDLARYSQLTRYSIDWIRKQTRQPFFIWIHQIDPHFPYQPRGVYAERYVRDDLKQTEFAGWCRREDWGHASIQRFVELCSRNEQDELEYAAAQYDAEINYVDGEFHRIHEALLAVSNAAPYLVAISSDHGESFGEAGRLLHGDLPFEEQIQVPLLLHGPGVVPAGMTCGRTASIMDLMPSLLRIAGAPLPGGLHGVDLLKMLDPAESHEERLAVCSGSYNSGFDHFEFGIRSRDGKLMAEWRGGQIQATAFYTYRTGLKERENRYGLESEAYGRHMKLLAEIGERMRREKPKIEPAAPLDEETRRQLTALGYLR